MTVHDALQDELTKQANIKNSKNFVEMIHFSEHHSELIVLVHLSGKLVMQIRDPSYATNLPCLVQIQNRGLSEWNW